MSNWFFQECIESGQDSLLLSAIASGELGEETPLIEAAFFGHASAVIALLRRGADRSAKDAFGRNAVMAAADGGHSDIVSILSISMLSNE